MDGTKDERGSGDTRGQTILAQWDFRIPILSNPTLMRSLGLAFGIPIVGMGLFLAVIAKPVVALVVSLCLAGLFFVGLLIATAVLGGGYNASFFLTSDGAWFLSGRREQRIADLVSAGGVVAGSLSAAGAGLLAQSEKCLFIPWKDVSTVKVSEGNRVITVRSGSSVKPIALYCTPENFREVRAIVRKQTSSAQE
jgi:hypothetical protein